MNTPIDVLLLAAMPEEADAFVSLCTDLEEHSHPFAGSTVMQVRTGSLAVQDLERGVSASAITSSVRVAIVTTGIGTAAAASAASWAVTALTPRVVMSIGSCGGLASDIAVGSVVVGTSYTYSIADATAFGYEPGQVPGAPSRFDSFPLGAGVSERIVAACNDAGLDARGGLMLSGDAFVTAALAEPMRAQFPGALSADMESTTLAHTCTLLGVQFVSVRSVSDLCSPRAGEEFHVGLDVAAAHSATAARIAIPFLLG